MLLFRNIHFLFFVLYRYKCKKVISTFFDKSLRGADFSCIVLPRLRPLSDRNTKSVPITCTESLAIHPIPTITSFNDMLLISSAF